MSNDYEHLIDFLQVDTPFDEAAWAGRPITDGTATLSPEPPTMDMPDGAAAEYRECLEVRRLLGYLWMATGRNARIPVYELFDPDDPIVADIERMAIFPESVTPDHDR